MTDAKDTVVDVPPVAPLPTVLAALQDPVRLEMVRRLSNAGIGTAVRCNSLYDAINKSTATHHFKILREAGVIERVIVDGQIWQRLRATDVEAALPGLLPSIVDAANRGAARARGGGARGEERRPHPRRAGG
uniref:ArsR/SmtB family transcription factor n=1 Tax=Nocardia brasiliensis TaxID=37326 RepID=UPI0024583963